MATNSISVTLTGYDALIKRMNQLPAKIRAKPGRRALGKAALAVKRQVVQNVRAIDDPLTGRQIRYNVAQRFRSRYFRSTGDLMISVGVLTNPGRIDPPSNPDRGARGPTPEWYLYELGTVKQPARPVVTPALSQAQNAAIAAFTREFQRALTDLGV